jgi:hypothetical protein
MAKPKSRNAADHGQIKARQAPIQVDNSEARPPVFSFEYLQSGWCIQDCESLERSKMLERLRILGQLPWKALRQAHKHGYGTETIAPGSLKVGIPSFVTADVRLLAFRAFEKVAMVGYKQDRIFHVIWIDREFKLYQH